MSSSAVHSTIFSRAGQFATADSCSLLVRVQIEYDGVKEYRESHSGIDTKIVFPKAAAKIVPTDKRTLFIDRLQPRTAYTFNISAYFTDDTWGPVHRIRVETSIGGTCCDCDRLMQKTGPGSARKFSKFGVFDQNGRTD